MLKFLDNLYISKAIAKECGLKSAILLTVLSDNYNKNLKNSLFIPFDTALRNEIKNVIGFSDYELRTHINALIKRQYISVRYDKRNRIIEYTLNSNI